jgi:acetyl-CoA carboxylase carboxyltransferase component
VDIVYREEINNASDPEAKRDELIEKFTDRTGAIRAAEGMGIDAVIDPRETRERVARALERAESNPNPEGLPPKHHGINPM